MSTPDRPRIVAVSVTFDRSALVARLVRAVASGTVLPDVLVVVDNASTDDTVAVLAGLEGLPEGVGGEPWLQVVVQDANTGGAGGFARGLREATARDAELIWLMDDDGVPAPDCLERLLPHAADHDFLGPVVVTEGAEDDLVFPIRVPGTATVLRRAAEVARHSDDDGLLIGIVIPFNGVLLTRALVERIGIVDERYFIWGDDVEYLWRAEAAGLPIATVEAARFVHPAVGDLGTPMALGQTYNHSPSDLKAYCMARNNWVNLRTYRGLPHALAFAAKTVWFYTLTRRDPRRLGLMLRGILAGMRGDFTGHERLLR